MEEERELSLEELTNVTNFGEIPREVVIEKSLDPKNNNNFRKIAIERLKEEKEALLNLNNINNKNGRSR